VELYKSQGNLNSLAIGLMETTQERTSNMLTGMLTGTQTLRDGMIGLFASLTQSVIKNLVDMAAQALITNTILKSIMGIGGGLFGGAAAGSTGTAISNFGSSFSFNAKGGVYDSPSLNSYSNGIYDSPTLFAFAKGAGVFGEAGPEAIMPLAKTSDGTLGVRALGNPGSSGGARGNGGIVYSPVYHFTIKNDGQNGEMGPQASQMLIKMVDSRVMGILRTQVRDGGMLAGG
ncbi:phage tail tape measure protein, partial [Salmonella enterica subsp. enterica]|nr:phage tail tape measure protein [Salmonella enterica subsp. enterica serovar Lattenkamp]EBW4471827.1 phage tail tape measure protein [Salmonella enterica subsp. enterica serovar Lattenkamp]